MDKLTLVEFHLHTDEFSPEATSIIGGRDSMFGRGRSDESRSDADGIGRSDGGGRAPRGLLVVLAVLAAAFVARKLDRRRGRDR